MPFANLKRGRVGNSKAKEKLDREGNYKKGRREEYIVKRTIKKRFEN